MWTTCGRLSTQCHNSQVPAPLAFTNYCFVSQAMATWGVERVRLHLLDKKAYTTGENWSATPLQVYRLLEQDFLYQCRAFKHVVPAIPMSVDTNSTYLTEDWRRYRTDLGYFACRHCRQYSKAKFCEEVDLSHACTVHIRLLTSSPS